MADQRSDLIGLLLIAGAGFLVYRSLSGRQTPATGDGAQPPATSPPSGTPRTDSGGQQTQPPTYQTMPGGGSTGGPAGGTAPPPAQRAPGVAQPSPTQQQTVWDRVREEARRVGRNTYTADEWNWFWSKVTGQTAPAPEDYGFTGESRLAKVDFETWKQMFTSHGFGLSGAGFYGSWVWARSPWEV